MSDATTKGSKACKEAQTESSLQLGDKSCGGDLAVSTSMRQGGGPEVLYCGGTSPLCTSKATAPSPPAQHNTHTSRYKWQTDDLQERHVRAAPAWPTAATPTATANLGKGEFAVRLAGEKGCGDP